MFGTYDGKFQIPNNPGQAPDPDFLASAGITGFDSAFLDERQRETNRYGILSLQSSIGPDFDYQVSLFTRYTSVHFTPDPLGDLVFNGVASDVLCSSFSTGIQSDGSYRLAYIFEQLGYSIDGAYVSMVAPAAAQYHQKGFFK